jgi:mRNA-degrading endonuclease RelE of RelBE toxin-antitoxin system
MWRVYVPTKLRKDLRRRFPVNAREAINAALRALERDGIHAAGVGYLMRDEYRWKGSGAGRDYRILFRATESIRFIQVQRIERRTTTTYRH